MIEIPPSHEGSPLKDIEAIEKKQIREIRYIYIEDDPHVQERIKQILETELGIPDDHCLSQDLSAEEAEKTMRGIRQPVDLILLDKSIPLFEKDNVPDVAGSHDVLRILDELAKDKRYKNYPAKSKVIVVSGAIERDDLMRYQARSPRVIATIDKYSESFVQEMKRVLTKSGWSDDDGSTTDKK